MQLDEQTLREFYTRHFGTVIHDAGLGVHAWRRTTSSTERSRPLERSPSHRHSSDGHRVQRVRPLGLVGAPAGDRDRPRTLAPGDGGGRDLRRRWIWSCPWAYNYAEIEAVTGTGLPLDAGTDRDLRERESSSRNTASSVDSIGSRFPDLKTPTTVIDSNGVDREQLPRTSRSRSGRRASRWCS